MIQDLEEKHLEKYKAYDGKEADKILKHIPEISVYNHNYFIGLQRSELGSADLVYAESDDDNLTEFWVLHGSSSEYLGYELTDNPGIVITKYRTT